MYIVVELRICSVYWCQEYIYKNCLELPSFKFDKKVDHFTAVTSSYEKYS